MTRNEMKTKLEEEFGGKWIDDSNDDSQDNPRTDSFRRVVDNIEVSFSQYHDGVHSNPSHIRFEVQVNGKLITTYIERSYHSFSKCIKGFNTFMESFESNLNKEKQKVGQSVLSFYAANKNCAKKKTPKKMRKGYGFGFGPC